MELTRRDKGVILTISCAIFMTVGMLAASVGPSLPSIAALVRTDPAAVGTIFTALFLGAIVTQLVSGHLTEKFGYRPVLAIGLALMAGGILGVLVSPFLPLSLALMFVGGLGNGIVIVVVNVHVSEVFGERSVSALNVLNIFFGMGAVAGPALVSLSLQWWGSGLPALAVISIASFLTVPFVLLAKAADHRRHGLLPADERGGVKSRPSGKSVYGAPSLWALGMILFLYVGIEVGTGGWTTAYVNRSTGLRFEDAALVASGFYLALTGGRIVATGLSLRLSAERILLIVFPGAVLAALLMVLGQGNLPVTVAAVLLLGFCIAPTYPTVVALATGAFKHAPARAASVVAALGSLGGSILPWLQGVLLEEGGPDLNSYYTLGMASALLGFFLLARVLLARSRVAG